MRDSSASTRALPAWVSALDGAGAQTHEAASNDVSHHLIAGEHCVYPEA
jgi:hypothetical protein